MTKSRQVLRREELVANKKATRPGLNVKKSFTFKVPKKNQPRRQILYTKIEGNKEISFHATKGIRVNRLYENACDKLG